jgi:hypothetical protein
MRKTKPFGASRRALGRAASRGPTNSSAQRALLKHDRNIGTDDQGSVFAGFTASGEMALRRFVKN